MNKIFYAYGTLAIALMFAGCSTENSMNVSSAKNATVASVSPGYTGMEAENAALSGGAKKNTNHAGYSGTGFVDGYFNVTGAQTMFTINAAVQNYYDINVAYSAGNGDCTNLGVYVNGVKLYTLNLYKTTNWDTWSTGGFITTLLNAGNNTIAFRSEGSSANCANIDYIEYKISMIRYPQITASAGSGGIINPSGVKTYGVTYNATYTIAPNSGYVVNQVTVDGAAVGAVTSYTFYNLTSNHTISATFKLGSAPAASVWELEDWVLSSPAKKNTNHSGYTGTGFVDGFINTTTAQISFKLPAFIGSYEFKLRYSAGNGASTNTEFGINSVKIKNLNCPKTTNWDTWGNSIERVDFVNAAVTGHYKAAVSSANCMNFDNLTMTPYIAVVQNPNDVYTCDGTTAGLAASATGGTGVLHYQWYKDGVAVQNGTSYTGANTNLLYVVASQSTIGTYYCKVTDDASPAHFMQSYTANFNSTTACY
jgi:hypothetical protein